MTIAAMTLCTSGHPNRDNAKNQHPSPSLLINCSCSQNLPRLPISDPPHYSSKNQTAPHLLDKYAITLVLRNEVQFIFPRLSMNFSKQIEFGKGFRYLGQKAAPDLFIILTSLTCPVSAAQPGLQNGHPKPEAPHNCHLLQFCRPPVR